jgi:hypothetical protein
MSFEDRSRRQHPTARPPAGSARAAVSAFWLPLILTSGRPHTTLHRVGYASRVIRPPPSTRQPRAQPLLEPRDRGAIAASLALTLGPRMVAQYRRSPRRSAARRWSSRRPPDLRPPSPVRREASELGGTGTKYPTPASQPETPVGMPAAGNIPGVAETLPRHRPRGPSRQRPGRARERRRSPAASPPRRASSGSWSAIASPERTARPRHGPRASEGRCA